MIIWITIYLFVMMSALTAVVIYAISPITKCETWGEQLLQPMVWYIIGVIIVFWILMLRLLI